MWVPDLTLCLILSVLACMTARNLISHRATMTVGGCSQSALTTPLFVRLVLMCVIKAIWPLLITVTNILLQDWIRDPIPSWPGWAAVHNRFHDIPAFPITSLSDEDVRNFARNAWYGNVSAFLVFGVFVCTENVVDDLSWFLALLTNKIPPVRDEKNRIRRRVIPQYRVTDHTISRDRRWSLVHRTRFIRDAVNKFNHSQFHTTRGGLLTDLEPRDR